MYLFFFLVFPLPSLVHDHVSPWPLQQFFLCCSSPWHCNGIQDITNYPVISDPQWQTGINFISFLSVDNRIILSSWLLELGSVGKLANGIYNHKEMGIGCMAVSSCYEQLCYKAHLKKCPVETQLLFLLEDCLRNSLIIKNLSLKSYKIRNCISDLSKEN